MNFYEHQKQNTLNAGNIATQDENAVVQLAGKLLLSIANHPSLMESTYEYNEEIQNAVNELAEQIIRRDELRKTLEEALEESEMDYDYE